MQATYRAKLAIWQAAHPPPVISTTLEDTLVQPKYALRPLVGQFHRCMTMMLVTSVVVSAMVWLGMRLIFPTTHHIDDLSGYEALMPGEIANPEDYSFHLLGDGSGQQQVELDTGQTNTYMNSTHKTQVVIIDVIYKQKRIVRFSIYSKQLRLLDLIWRWGRPTSKKKAIVAGYWDFKWLGDKYTVSVDCHTLKLEAPVALVIITLN